MGSREGGDLLTARRGGKNLRMVAWFNEVCPVGSPVFYWPGVREGEPRKSVTRSEAWLLGGHTPVVMVEGYAGGIALSHVMGYRPETGPVMTPDAAGIEAALAAGLTEALLREQFGGSYDDIMAGPSGPAWREGDVSRQAARLAAALLPVVTQAQAAERERIAQAIEAGPWGRGMPNGMHMEAIRACARIARADESGA